MQRTYKKAVCSLIIAIILSAVFAVLRSIIMTANFDTASGFFINKTIATIIYLSLITFVIIIFYASKSIRTLSREQSKVLSTIFSAVSAVAFVFIVISLFSEVGAETQINRIASGVASVFAVLSAVYYFLKIVNNNIFTSFLSISPLVFFLAYLIDYFVKISGHANTYYLFPDFFSILVLIYFLMSLGKAEHLNAEECPLFSASVITICTLSFSVFPDIYLALTEVVKLTYLNAAICMFKLINLVLALYTAVSVIKKTKEENK